MSTEAECVQFLRDYKLSWKSVLVSKRLEQIYNDNPTKLEHQKRQTQFIEQQVSYILAKSFTISNSIAKTNLTKAFMKLQQNKEMKDLFNDSVLGQLEKSGFDTDKLDKSFGLQLFDTSFGFNENIKHIPTTVEEIWEEKNALEKRIEELRIEIEIGDKAAEQEREKFKQVDAPTASLRKIPCFVTMVFEKQELRQAESRLKTLNDLSSMASQTQFSYSGIGVPFVGALGESVLKELYEEDGDDALNISDLSRIDSPEGTPFKNLPPPITPLATGKRPNSALSRLHLTPVSKKLDTPRFFSRTPLPTSRSNGSFPEMGSLAALDENPDLLTLRMWLKKFKSVMSDRMEHVDDEASVLEAPFLTDAEAFIDQLAEESGNTCQAVSDESIKCLWSLLCEVVVLGNKALNLGSSMIHNGGAIDTPSRPLEFGEDPSLLEITNDDFCGSDLSNLELSLSQIEEMKKSKASASGVFLPKLGQSQLPEELPSDDLMNNEEVNKLRAQVLTLQQKINELEAMNKNLEVDNESLKSSNDEKLALAQKSNQLALKELENSLNKLHSDSLKESKKAWTNKYEVECKSLSSKISQQKDAISHANRELKDLKKKMNIKENELQKLQKENRNVTKRVDTISKDRDGMDKIRARLQDLNTQLIKQKEDIERKLNVTEQSLNELRNEKDGDVGRDMLRNELQLQRRKNMEGADRRKEHRRRLADFARELYGLTHPSEVGKHSELDSDVPAFDDILTSLHKSSEAMKGVVLNISSSDASPSSSRYLKPPTSLSNPNELQIQIGILKNVLKEKEEEIQQLQNSNSNLNSHQVHFELVACKKQVNVLTERLNSMKLKWQEQRLDNQRLLAEVISAKEDTANMKAFASEIEDQLSGMRICMDY